MNISKCNNISWVVVGLKSKKCEIVVFPQKRADFGVAKVDAIKVTVSWKSVQNKCCVIKYKSESRRANMYTLR